MAALCPWIFLFRIFTSERHHQWDRDQTSSHQVTSGGAGDTEAFGDAVEIFEVMKIGCFLIVWLAVKVGVLTVKIGVLTLIKVYKIIQFYPKIILKLKL